MLNLQEIFPVNSKPIHRVILTLLALVAFSLPFKDQFLVNLFIILVIAVWLISNPFKALFSKRINLKSLLAMVFFYALHAMALLYTNNMGEGLFSLEIKVSLLAFPLIFYSFDYGRNQIIFFMQESL